MKSYDRGRNYNDRMKAATNRLNSAEVAIYPVDARGLQTDRAFTAWPGSAVMRPALGGLPWLRTVCNLRAASAEQGSMDLIAEQTGGRAFYNTNGLEEALETGS